MCVSALSNLSSLTETYQDPRPSGSRSTPVPTGEDPGERTRPPVAEEGLGSDQERKWADVGAEERNIPGVGII